MRIYLITSQVVNAVIFTKTYIFLLVDFIGFTFLNFEKFEFLCLSPNVATDTLRNFKHLDAQLDFLQKLNYAVK